MHTIDAAWRFLTLPRGHARWRVFLRATAVVCLAAIPVALLVDAWIPYVWLALVGLPANSPLSPILPTVWDPLLMEVAKYRAPAGVATVAVGIYMYSEYLNWHIYKWVLDWDRLSALRENRWVRWGVHLFGRSPIFAIVFFAVTPMPFWVVRSLAILKQYPIARFMVATAVGRWPRYFAYAWVGDALQVPWWIILAAIVIPCSLVVAVKLARREPIFDDAILDAGEIPQGAEATP